MTVSFFDMQRRQRQRTAVLLIIGLVLLTGVGYLMTIPWQFWRSCSESDVDGCAPLGFSLVALLVAFGSMIVYLWVSLALAQRRTFPPHGRPLGSSHKERQLRNAVDQMCIASGLPFASVQVVDDSSLNAFAAWNRDIPEVVFTSELVAVLDVRQLTGVAAHEVAHLKNRDSRLIMLATFGIGLIVVLATFATAVAAAALASDDAPRRNSKDEKSGAGAAGLAIAALLFAALLWLVAFPLALVVRATISRRREYLADASAVQYTRDPGALREALEVLASSSVAPRYVSASNAPLWIRSPGSNLNVLAPLSRLLDTHPPLERRIAWLRDLERVNAVWLPLP